MRWPTISPTSCGGWHYLRQSRTGRWPASGAKLVKIGAKIVTHARYVTFQMAEVAVPRELVQDILRLIDGLRPRPVPA